MSCHDFFNVLWQMCSQEWNRIENPPARPSKDIQDLNRNQILGRRRCCCWPRLRLDLCLDAHDLGLCLCLDVQDQPRRQPPLLHRVPFFFFCRLTFSPVESLKLHSHIRTYAATCLRTTYVRTSVSLIFQSQINTYIHLIKYSAILIRLHDVRRRWQLRQKHR